GRTKVATVMRHASARRMGRSIVCPPHWRRFFIGARSPGVRAATLARVFRERLTVCAALSFRGRRIGDRARQRLGETAVAPVVHMQAIRREKYLERYAVDVVPVPHSRSSAA